MCDSRFMLACRMRISFAMLAGVPASLSRFLNNMAADGGQRTEEEGMGYRKFQHYHPC